MNLNKRDGDEMASQPERASQLKRQTPASAMLAFEKLLDLQERPGPSVELEAREARRLCGRWLALRRTERKLTLADVAWRTEIDMQVLELLEQGVADSPAVEPAAWHALALVLERDNNDLAFVEDVLAVAVGLDAAPQEAWLQQLNEALLVSSEQFEQPAQPAPMQSEEPIGRQLLLQLVASLRVLRRSPSRSLSTYELYKGVTQEEGEQLEFALLPEYMEQMERFQLVRRVAGERVVFELTNSGDQFFMKSSIFLEEQQRLKDQRDRTERAKAEFKRLFPNVSS